jgi:DNA-binding response OmpR family regulator
MRAGGHRSLREAALDLVAAGVTSLAEVDRVLSDDDDAIELALREQPDLLLIDLMMPEMDGYAAIGALRGHPRLRALPVLVLTAESEAGVEERVLELGADDYVLKPFEPGVLVSRVRAVFKRLARFNQ